MKVIEFGKSKITSNERAFFIAEIGHNHQGNLETAKKMIKIAAEAGADAVKFQKRDNKSLYTNAFYNRLYDNENSYGNTYGEHREYLEFDKVEYIQLKKCAEANKIEFMCTAFDFESVDFLEEIGISSYKVASGDITNTPLLTYIAKLGKPMFLSTGACSLDEIQIAYNTVLTYHDKLCLMHCTAGYPTEYQDLNLRVIETLKQNFTEALIGYSGHDNGILASVIAFMLGATVIEKHFTLNHAWKGTDHKFSLEPEGLRKQIRDLRRIESSLGNGIKEMHDFEKEARKKMGKGVYSTKPLKAGTILTKEDICLRTPANETAPYNFEKIIGKKLKKDLGFEESILLDDLE